MSDFAIGTSPLVELVQAQVALDAGLPLPCVFFGLGRHVEQTEDPASPGWSRAVFPVLEHPGGGLFAYQVPDGPYRVELEAKLPPQAAALVVAAAPLSPDWFPPGLQDSHMMRSTPSR